MAEVGLRLLRCRPWQLPLQDSTPSKRIQVGPRESTCVLSGICCRAIDLSKTEQTLRSRRLWPSTAPRRLSVWVAEEHLAHAVQGTRFFERVASRSFSQQARRHGSGPSHGARVEEPPLYRSPTGYYDVLDVSRSAPQSQIKAAYYKQSFRFHPDRNPGNQDAVRRFGLVTEAYYVLGSVSLRKKYDRGTLSLEDVRTAKKPSSNGDAPTRSGTPAQRRTSSASSSWSPAKPMFDFDAFYRAHYGDQLAREQAWRARKAHLDKLKHERKMSDQSNTQGDFSGVMVLLVVAIIVLYLK